MRDDLGKFVKGHIVPQEWRNKLSLSNKGKPNPKNKYPRTEKQLKNLKTINLGRTPYNRGIGSRIFNCEVCGEEVFDKPYRRKRTCSYECRTILSHINRGVNHWNYKGENNCLQRCWSEYKEWHKKVLEKDNYTCQVCRKVGGSLQVHHIKSFSKYQDLRFDVSNGQTVHKYCHLKKLHGWEI